jgi:hypothetical protein
LSETRSTKSPCPCECKIVDWQKLAEEVNGRYILPEKFRNSGEKVYDVS